MSWLRGTVTSPQKTRAIVLADGESGGGRTWYHARYANCEPETADFNPLREGEKVAFRRTYLGNDKYGASEVLRIELLPLEGLLEARDALCMKDDVLEGKHRKYKLVKELGAGAAGAVWRAKVVEDGTLVAIKILCPSPRLVAQGKLENVVERFCRERAIGMTLHHPNIVKYLDAGTHVSLPFCCLELCDHSVADEVRREKRLALPRTVQIVSQLIAGLKYLHTLGIVHRDVKPANVLVRSDGSVCLGDLGIIHIEDAKDEIAAIQEFTGSAMNLGSWFYMSPEQRRAFGTVGPMADVYALGVSWYEMLEGGFVPGPERFAAKDYSFTESRLNPLLTVISRMMEYAPKDRPALDRISSALRFASNGYEKEVERLIRHGLIERGAREPERQAIGETWRLMPLLGFSEQETQTYLSQSGCRVPPPVLSEESGEVLNEAEAESYLLELAVWAAETIADHELTS